MTLSKTIAKARQLLERHVVHHEIRVILADIAWTKLDAALVAKTEVSVAVKNEIRNEFDIYSSLLRNQLFAVARSEEQVTPTYRKALYQDVYTVLLLLAHCWPRNEIEGDGMQWDWISPISLSSMESPIGIASGHLFDKKELLDLIKYGKDPTTNKSFLKREIPYLKYKSGFPGYENYLKVEIIEAEFKAKDRRTIELYEIFGVNFLIAQNCLLALFFLAPIPVFLGCAILAPLLLGVVSLITSITYWPIVPNEHGNVELLMDLADQEKAVQVQNNPARLASSAVIAVALAGDEPEIIRRNDAVLNIELESVRMDNHRNLQDDVNASQEGQPAPARNVMR